MHSVDNSIFQNIAVVTPVPQLHIESIVDHPGTWVELLDFLPYVDGGNFCLSADMGPGHTLTVTPMVTEDFVRNEDGVSGYRNFGLCIVDGRNVFAFAVKLGVKATADNVLLTMELLEKKATQFSSVYMNTALGKAMGSILATALQMSTIVHANLSEDLSETKVDCAIVVPNDEYAHIAKVATAEFEQVVATFEARAKVAAAATCSALFADQPVEKTYSSDRVSLPMEQRLALAVNLIKLRENAGLTQLQVSFNALGFEKSHAAISRLERGILAEVDAERLELLAEFFGTSVKALLSNGSTNGAPAEEGDEAKGPSLFEAENDFVPSAHFGSRIRLARTSKGMSQKALALALNHTTESVVNTWEEELATPRRTSFIDVAIALDVPVSYLMYGRRIATPTRGTALRLTALQKLYGLSNYEISALMDSTYDAERIIAEGKVVNRITTGRKLANIVTVEKLARVFQVPVQWLAPTIEERQAHHRVEKDAVSVSGEGILDTKVQHLNRASKKLVVDLIALLEMDMVSKEQVQEMQDELYERFTAPMFHCARMSSR